MSDTPPSGDSRVSKPASIDWLATSAGALAAVTSALLLSTLGAVGTLVGAAIGSVAATVGTNLYSQWLAKSREKMANAQALARWRSAGLAGVRSGSEAVSESSAAESEAPAESGDTEPAPSWRERLRELPWKRIALVSLAMFLVVVVAITIFELVAGRSVTSIVRGGEGGGTTLSRVTDTDESDEDQGEDQGEDPSPGTTATPEESSSASTEPSEDAQESAPAESGSPSVGASTSPGSSAEPTEQPSEGTSTEPTTGASEEAGDQASP